MVIQLKSVMDVDIGSCVAAVVGASGIAGMPTITSKEGLANALIGPIGRIIAGASMHGLRAEDLTFTIPAELHMLCRFTVFRDNESRSVLDVVAGCLNIPPSRIAAEYPTPDRAWQTVEFAEGMLSEAKLELAKVRQQRDNLSAEVLGLRRRLGDDH